MDHSALRTFVLAAETLNFTTVADLRNTVQSAVSAQIRKLEHELGCSLFDRGRGQKMHLTPQGTALLVYAKRILALSEEAVETVRTSQSKDVIRLGTTVTLSLSIVCDVLASFAAHHPDIQIQIQCDRSDALLARLDANDIDVAFMMDQGRRPDRAFVHSQPLVWACSSGFDLQYGQPIPMAFLTDGRDLRRYALHALDDVGREGQIKYLSPDPIGVRSFVQAGLALTVMPMATVTTPLRTAPSAFELPDLPPAALAAYHPGTTRTDAVNHLLNLLEIASHQY